MQVATHCCRELRSWVTIGGVEWLKRASCRRAEGEHAMADKTGSCLCGAVAFEITGPLRSVIACHCHQCRKQTGTYMSSTAVKDEQFRLTETRGLKWYRSSNTGRRGFCEQCGSVLFWKGDGYDYIAIAAGSIDGKLGVIRRTLRHGNPGAGPHPRPRHVTPL